MKNKQLTRSLKIINSTLGALWGIGLGIGIAISIVICEKTHCHTNELSNDDVSKLLGAFAILISAGIASASVMKNIAETKAHDLAKSEKEKLRKRIFALKIMQTIHYTIQSLNESQDHQSIDLLYLDFKANMETVQKSIESIFSESILPYLLENEQKKIYVFYATFTKFLFFKQLSKPNTDSTEDMNGFIEVVKKYKEQFGTHSKEYIEEYKNTKES